MMKNWHVENITQCLIQTIARMIMNRRLVICVIILKSYIQKMDMRYLNGIAKRYFGRNILNGISI